MNKFLLVFNCDLVEGKRDGLTTDSPKKLGFTFKLYNYRLFWRRSSTSQGELVSSFVTTLQLKVTKKNGLWYTRHARCVCLQISNIFNKAVIYWPNYEKQIV